MTSLSILLTAYFSAEGVFDGRSLELVPPIATSMFTYLHGRWLPFSTKNGTNYKIEYKSTTEHCNADGLSQIFFPLER